MSNPSSEFCKHGEYYGECAAQECEELYRLWLAESDELFPEPSLG